MEREHEIEMLQNLSSLESSGTLDGKRIYVFGHCDASERMIDMLGKRGMAIAGIADNNPAKHGTAYKGVAVSSPQKCFVPHRMDAEILIASRHCSSISRQLAEMGYEGHIHSMVNFNTFSEYSLTDETFAEKTARVQKGIAVIETIRARFPKEFLVVCPYNALGDVYIALAYLPHYLVVRGIADCAVIVTGNGCLQTAAMFGVPKVEALPRLKMDQFVQALIFTDEPNSIIAHHDRPYTNKSIRFSDKNHFNMEDHYKVSVYGLDVKTAPMLPKRKEYSGAFPFPKARSVLLAPYAKSVVALPDGFWAELVQALAGEGYTVLTNISGGEEPLADTLPLSLTLAETVAATQWAGAFIGLRSGLCDIMRHADCRKIKLYPDCIYSTTGMSVREFAPIPDDDNTVNIVFDPRTVFDEISATIQQHLKNTSSCAKSQDPYVEITGFCDFAQNDE